MAGADHDPMMIRCIGLCRITNREITTYCHPHTEEPAEYLVELLKKNKVKVGLALDVCSGAGHPIIDLM